MKKTKVTSDIDMDQMFDFRPEVVVKLSDAGAIAAETSLEQPEISFRNVDGNLELTWRAVFPPA